MQHANNGENDDCDYTRICLYVKPEKLYSKWKRLEWGGKERKKELKKKKNRRVSCLGSSHKPNQYQLYEGKIHATLYRTTIVNHIIRLRKS